MKLLPAIGSGVLDVAQARRRSRDGTWTWNVFSAPTAKLGIEQLRTAPFRRALGVVEISVPRPKNQPVTGTLVTIAGPSLRTVIGLDPASWTRCLYV